MTLGQRIRSARKAKGLTQAALGGGRVSSSYISMLEHDRLRPSIATLRLIAERLGQPPAAFLDAAPTPREQAAVILQRAESLLRQHRFTEALDAFRAAEAPARESGERALVLRCDLGAGQALAGLRQFDLAEGHLASARVRAEEVGDPALIAAAANAAGFLAFRARRFAAARQIFQHGIDRLRASGIDDGEALGKLLSNLGRVYVELGLPAQALTCLQEASACLRRAADPAHRALLLFNMGIACERQQDYTQAETYLQQAEALLGIQNNLALLGTVKRSLGMLALDRGQWQDAETYLTDSLHLARQSHDDEGTAQALVELARLRVRRGDPERARGEAAEAEALARRIQDEAEAARAVVADAEALRAAGRLDEAAERYTTAIRTFERLGMASDLSYACRDLGYLLLAVGRAEAAAAQFARAFDLQREAQRLAPA